jgi:hypothetical protein
MQGNNPSNIYFFPVKSIEGKLVWTLKKQGGMFLGLQIGFPVQKEKRIGLKRYQWQRTTIHIGLLFFSLTLVFNDYRKVSEPPIRINIDDLKLRAARPLALPPIPVSPS